MTSSSEQVKLSLREMSAQTGAQEHGSYAASCQDESKGKYETHDSDFADRLKIPTVDSSSLLLA